MAIPILQRRRIEAEILKQVYDTASERHGKQEAAKIVGEAVQRSARAQARQYAESAPEEGTSMGTFIDLYADWMADDALTVEVLRQDDEAFDFNVTRCRYAEMYRDMGLEELGPLLSCNRDGVFCQGYDENIELTRNQTIMKGASHCDFRYRYKR